MKKVMLGLSGGVDSAVAAYLLKEQGYDVTACFMRNWDSLTNNDYLGNPNIGKDQCPQEKDYYDAMKVAEELNIPFLRVDFVKEYWDNVFSMFLKEYERGRTPNPDVFCNKYIKFDAFLKFAESKGFDTIAMGHYAKREDRDGKSYLLKAFDKSKDQSYFLSQISQEQLSHALFPLGDIEKHEVREIAHKLHLETVMDKKDSTGVCFIGERNFKKFLQNYFPAQEGKIVDVVSKKVIGKHEGVLYYTIGQRKGLGIGGIKGLPTNGWFVVDKDVKKNILYVSSGDESSFLLSKGCTITNLSFINDKPIINEKVYGAKFRYREPDNEVRVSSIIGDTMTLEFVKPVRAVTPGQIAVIYDGEDLVGGGIIDTIIK